MSKRVLFLLALVALVVAACQPIQPEAAPMPAPQSGSPLAGSHWLLTSLSGQPALTEVNVTAFFGTDGNISGSGGCNNYGSSYTVDGSALTIGPNIMSTMMACPEPIMQQEQAYFQALSSVAAFTLTGETLSLSDASGAVILEFAAQSQGLGGTSWLVTGYNNGREAVVSPLLDTELTINFGTDGTVSGNSGCNNYTGAFLTSGDAITIGPLASTMMMCENEEVMQQEAEFLAALESSATYSVRGTLFETRTADDAMAINAVPPQ